MPPKEDVNLKHLNDAIAGIIKAVTGLDEAKIAISRGTGPDIGVLQRKVEDARESVILTWHAMSALSNYLRREAENTPPSP